MIVVIGLEKAIGMVEICPPHKILGVDEKCVWTLRFDFLPEYKSEKDVQELMK